MPNTTDWNSVATWERLVASIVASGVKLDLKAVASCYGTTYSTLENRFRKIKKDAEQLQQNSEGGGDGKAVASPVKAPPKTPRKPKTPKKDPLDTVKEGRVSKKSSAKKNGIKPEPMEDDVSDGAVEGNHRVSPGLDDDIFT